MADIIFPNKLNELINSESDSNGFFISSPWDSSEQSESEISSKIDDLHELACNDILDRFTQSYIDDIYSVIDGFDNLSSQMKFRTVEVLMDAVASGINYANKHELSNDQKNTMNILVYFLSTLVIKIENHPFTAVVAPTGKKTKATKAKGSSAASFEWDDWNITVVETLLTYLDIQQSKLWKMGIIQESFLSCLWTAAYQLIEHHPSNALSHDKVIKTKATMLISKSIAYFQSNQGSYSSLSTTLLTGLLQHEHIATTAAQVCSISKALMTELLSDITTMDTKNVTAGLKNIGAFIESYAKLSAHGVVSFLPLLMKLLDSPSYQIRSSLLASFGTIMIQVHKSFALSQGENYEVKLKSLAKKAAPYDEEHDNNEEDEDEEVVVEEEEKSEEQNLDALFRTREALLDILIERVHDVNYYTRAEVLRVWSSLCEATAIPCRRYGAVAELACDRLKDKTAIVRRQAIALLVSLLDNNPFAGDLNVDRFELMKKDIDQLYKLRLSELVIQLRQTQTDDDAAANPTEMDDEDWMDHPQIQEDTIIQDIRFKVSYCVSAIEFITFVTNASEHISLFIKSKTASDIVETLRFFKRAVNFSVKDSAKHLRSCFSLIWHQDAAIRKECLESFYDVFLSDGSGQNVALSANEISQNLIELLQRCSTNKVECDSLEQIIGELFAQEKVGTNVITSLWNRLQGDLEHLKAGSFVENQHNIGNVISMLRMISQRLPQILTMNKVSLLVDLGYHHMMFQSYDSNTLRATSRCLLNIPIKAEHMTADIPSDILESIMMAIRKIILGIGCPEPQTSSWFSICEESIRVVYHLHPNPDHLMTNLILPYYASISDPTVSNNLSPVHLARFLYIIGQTASCTLVYAEKLASLAKKITVAATATSSAEQHDDDDAMEDEMGMAQANDAEADRYYAYMTEKHLVIDNLLGKFRPMIINIITMNHASTSNHASKSRYHHIMIRQASTMALCRYMSISSEVCEELLPLLFTALERDEDPHIRTMIIVCLGDLAFRFPNAVEPWTNRIYDRLSDDHLLVRYNTLMVLSHLILHDMVKVKGHVSAIVLCLCDEEEMISDLASLFFIKLAERSNNPIYNLLGDIISTLSSTTSNTHPDDDKMTSSDDKKKETKKILTTKDFESAMKFLLSFVKKDKLADGLMERLLTRISLSDDLHQRRNLAFCISELSITEKGVKKLVDTIKLVKDALYDRQIFDYVKMLVQKAKKSVRCFGSKDTSSSSPATTGDDDTANQTQSSSGKSSTKVAAASGGMTDTIKGYFEELDKFLDETELDATGRRADHIDAATGEDGDDEPNNHDHMKENQSVMVKKPRAKAGSNKAKKATKKKSIDYDEDMDDEVDDNQYSDVEENQKSTVAITKAKVRRVLQEVNHNEEEF